MTRALPLLFALALGCGDADVAGRADEVTEARPSSPSLRLVLLPAASRAVVERSRIPLLVPRDPQLLASAVVTGGERWIALSAAGDGITVSVHGTRQQPVDIADEEPPSRPNDQVRGAPAVVTSNDGIRSATWDEAGTAWALDVECEDPGSDPRCTGEDFIRALAERLELIGGGP